MSRSIATLLVVTLLLGACSTRINPFNWFGGSRNEPRPERQVNDNPLIPEERERRGFFNLRAARERANIYRGEPVDVISNLVIERVPGGAVIRATGLSRYQNVYDVQLTPLDEDQGEDGVLAYRLEAVIPERPIAGGPERLRRISAAQAVTDQDLENIRAIRVAGIENARVSRR